MRVRTGNQSSKHTELDDGSTLAGLEDEIQEFNYRRLETVLVIEDHEDLNRALALRLEAEGLTVASAYDGIAGLDKIRRLEPDAIVLDLRLPRMHGFKMLHALRTHRNLREAPIIVVTGDPDPEIEKRAHSWGVARIFRKPVEQASVVQAVLEVLRGE